LFLLVFGAGFHDSFFYKQKDISYILFFFPGILGLVLLFSSIYSTITLVDDKKCGFFRLVLVGPGGVFAAIFGKILATAFLGFIQSALFLLLIFVLPITYTWWSLLYSLLVIFLGAFMFAVLGVLCAYLSPSSSAFHAIMSIVLLPMWLLSGAMFPLPGYLTALSIINPMSYVVSALRGNFLSLSLLWKDCVFMVIFILVFTMALTVVIRKRPLTIC
jgi:ABC-2 type transport system permease protein